MMASEVDIANSALDKLGVEPINSFTEDNNRAKLCNRSYPLMRDEVLRSHPWKCAMKRITLTALTSTPAFEYQYEFQLPSDCLRVWKVGSDGECKWTEEGGKLLFNDSTAEIQYIRRVPVGQLDSSVTEVIAFRMAMHMCYQITQSTPRLQEIKAEYLLFLADARSFSAQSAQQTTYTVDTFTNVRY